MINSSSNYTVPAQDERSSSSSVLLQSLEDMAEVIGLNVTDSLSSFSYSGENIMREEYIQLEECRWHQPFWRCNNDQLSYSFP